MNHTVEVERWIGPVKKWTQRTPISSQLYSAVDTALLKAVLMEEAKRECRAAGYKPLDRETRYRLSDDESSDGYVATVTVRCVDGPS